MNIPVFSRACLLVCGLWLFAASISSASIDADEPVLKVQVNLPASWNPAPGDPLPDFIAGSISDAIMRQIFTWPVAAVRSSEDVQRAAYLLKIDVTEWRRTSDGDFSCTFAATLRTPHEERRIGIYSNTTWAPGVLYADSTSAYYPTPLDPIHALVRDLENSGLLRDTSQAKSRSGSAPPPEETG